MIFTAKHARMHATHSPAHILGGVHSGSQQDVRVSHARLWFKKGRYDKTRYMAHMS